MKKILLIGMLVVGGLSYGRDYEYRERKELQELFQESKYENPEMISRERKLSEDNMKKYADFHRDLDNMDRGSERN